MAWLKLVLLALQASILVLVFVLGLQATWSDAVSLFRRPAMLMRSFLSMNAIMPLIAAALAALFNLRAPVKIALVLLAVSPVPPILPRKQLKVAGKSAYIFGLLAAMSVLSIFVVPVTINLLGKAFSKEVHIDAAVVAKVIFRTVLLPLVAGIFARSRWPDLTQRVSAPLSAAANGLLLVAAIPLLFLAWKPMWVLMGNGTILAMAAFVIVAVVVGHWLGRPDPAEQTTLALATASRHPGLAMAIASANFPGQRLLIGAAVLLYLLVNAVALIPYVRWSKRRLTLLFRSPSEISAREAEHSDWERRKRIA